MVQPENLGRFIDEHPFFQGIDAGLRDLLVGCAANERYEAGQFLFREGQAAKKFFLIRAGAVAVEIDRPGRPPIIIETIGEGEIAGWAWIVPPYRSTFDARAATLVRALSFDGECLRRKMQTDPALGYEVLRRFVPVMAHRLGAARLQMLDLYAPADRSAAFEPIKVEAADTKTKGRNRAADDRLKKAETKAKDKPKDKSKAKGKKKGK